MGNFGEYTPFMFLGILILEMQGLLLMAALVAMLFLFGRIMHAYSMLIKEEASGVYSYRVYGMMVTLFCYLSVGFTLLLRGFMATI